MYERTDMFDLGLERIVIFDLLFDLLTRVNDRRMVATTELLPDRRVGDVEFLTQNIHDDLPRLHHLLLACLSRRYSFRRSRSIPRCDAPPPRRKRPDSASVVLYQRAHIGLRDGLAFEL